VRVTPTTAGPPPEDGPPSDIPRGRIGRRGFLVGSSSAAAWVLVSGLPFAPRSATPPGLESAVLRLTDGVSGYAGGGAGPGPAVGPGFSTAVELPIPGQMVTLTWDGPAEAALRIRSHHASRGWSGWTSLAGHAGEGPDPGRIEGNGRHGVGPVWLGDDATHVEVGVDAGRLSGLELDTLRAVEPRSGWFGLDAAAAAPGTPAIVPRSAWGAGPWNQSVAGCDAGPRLARHANLVIVHHTVTTNSYSAGQAGGLIRGIWHYHVNSRGWCDVAYNFFVDRFGTIYEGRTGSIAGPVIGGHAAGFNTGSIGVALLGQYQPGGTPSAASVSTAQRTGLRRLVAWLCGEYGLDARATPTVVSLGGTRWAEGTAVPLSSIATHRDVSVTSCAGTNAISVLPSLRSQVQSDVALDVPFPRSRWTHEPAEPKLVVLDAYGGVHPAGGTPKLTRHSTYWTGWKVARAVLATGDGQGYVCDRNGGLHAFGGAPNARGSGYWPGVDSVRGLLPGPTPGSGYVLHRTGSLHPFGGAPPARAPGIWPAAWDIAVSAASAPGGTGGYVLDGFGGLHAWGSAPRATGVTGYWPGWRIARDVGLRPDGVSGWVLDGFGGLHPFGGAPRLTSSSYTRGDDRWRSIVVNPDGTGGWILDRDGHIGTFGAAPRVTRRFTFTGLGLAIGVALSPTPGAGGSTGAPGLPSESESPLEP